MKKVFLFVLMILLCGCTSQSSVHVCKMNSDPVQWQIEYTLDDDDQLVQMAQILKITCQDEAEKEEYEQNIIPIFDDYLENYSEACQIENKDDHLNIERVLLIDFTKLSDDKKEEMGYESKEEYLIAQLEFAGYECE